MSLWRREFWKTYWIAVRRCKTDSRSRRVVIRTSVRLLILPLYLCFWAIVFSQSGDRLWIIAWDALILSCAALIVMALRKSHQREDALFSFVPAATRQSTEPRYAESVVRQYLIERTIIAATLLARAASESFLHEKHLPNDVSVVTRQTQIENLRKQGLWDKISVKEGDLLRIADGHWTVEQVNNVVVPVAEQLRLLRWVLGVDAQITPLAFFPRPDATLTAEITQKGQSAFNGKTMLAPWDVRLERNIAREYVARCLAEQQSRGLVNGPAEFVKWAQDVQAQFASPSQDMLVGTKAISELGDSDLGEFRSIATARENYSNYLIDQLSADRPVDFSDCTRRKADQIHSTN